MGEVVMATAQELAGSRTRTWSSRATGCSTCASACAAETRTAALAGGGSKRSERNRGARI